MAGGHGLNSHGDKIPVECSRPTCTATAWLTVDYLQRLEREGKPILCSLCRHREASSRYERQRKANGGKLRRNETVMSLNGCEVMEKRDKRCQGYLKCPNAYDCYDRLARLDWSGWVTECRG